MAWMALNFVSFNETKTELRVSEGTVGHCFVDFLLHLLLLNFGMNKPSQTGLLNGTPQTRLKPHFFFFFLAFDTV